MIVDPVGSDSVPVSFGSPAGGEGGFGPVTELPPLQPINVSALDESTAMASRRFMLHRRTSIGRGAG
ncbi:MAG: hypothetical protein IPP98_12885 [Gemmatimonadetes bacterium]|nr:hypothetical protein [Gemmatimonadota bacterium]